MSQAGYRCAVCDGSAQYIDSQTGQALCLEHCRLEVTARRHSGRWESDRPAMAVRPATPDDYHAVRTIALHFWDDTEMDCFDRTYNMLDLPSLLLCEGEHVVGCLTYSEDVEDDALTLVMVNIYPGYNGYGGGRSLIEAAEAAARECELGRLRVATSNDNLLALYFYQRLGFRIIGVKVNAIHGDIRGFAGIPVRDEIQLERPLAHL